MTDFHQTVDDLIMQLVQMGFELEDCQLAIENGKLTAGEIVDWITAGKPRAESKQTGQAVLKLGKAAEKYIEPLSPTSEQRPATSFWKSDHAFGLERAPAAEEEAPIVSRVNRSEEQRQVKLKFEEKQRQEAQKQAQLDKIAKKKAHDEALKRIQEDRENLRARTTPVGSQLSANNNNAAAFASKESGQTSTAKDLGNTILQFRLADGKNLRQTFTSDTCLDEVKEFVQVHCGITDDISFIQPFPRVEFSSADLNRSLRELGLVPNGSLVIKRSESAVAQASGESDLQQTESSDTEPSRKKKPPVEYPGVLPFVPPPVVTSHPWGMGQQLVGNQEEPMQEEEDDEEEIGQGNEVHTDSEASDMDDDFDPQVPAHGLNFPAQLPAFPPNNHGFAPGFWGGPQPIQHDWGFGNVLAGEVLENVTLPHHQKDPRALAAEAASQRFTSQPDPAPLPSRHHDVEFPRVLSLRELVLKNIAMQMCDARSPVVGLRGIPGDLATPILDTLVKERVLKPATLQMFISCRMQKIVLDSYPYCTNELIRGIRHHSYLKRLSLKSCQLITEKGLQALTGLKYLKFLNLASCKKVDDTCVHVFQALSSLETLILEDTSVTDVGIKQYASSEPPSLRSLDLSHTTVTEAIFSHLAKMPSLCSLNLEQTKITSLSGIQGLVKLISLNISNTQIVTDSILCLQSLSSLVSLRCSSTPNVNGDIAVSYLAHLPLREIYLPNRLTTTDVAISHISGMKLTELDLSNYIYITDGSMDFIGQLRGLTKLLLSNTKVTDAGLKCLEGLVNLEELNLDRTAVTNAVATTIRAFVNLRQLSLCSTGISNGFLLSGALKPCIELIRLNLSKNRISDRGIVCLHLPNLTTLKIDNTFIRPETIDVVKSGCPLLEKFTYKTLQLPPQNELDLE